MKLIPTSSQTVGPFFSIGMARHYRENPAQDSVSGAAITITGKVFDGDSKPIPDAILEFWGEETFARVPTSEDGLFFVNLDRPAAHGSESEKTAPIHFEVLIFMRGILKPVFARVYLAEAGALRNLSELKTIPPQRIATLAAKTDTAPNRYGWDIHMQGENETVFFEY